MTRAWLADTPMSDANSAIRGQAEIMSAWVIMSI